MPFGLASMTRVKSGAYSVRKAIPADVRNEYKKLYEQGWEAKLTLPPSMTPQEAKAKQAEFLATVERRIQAIRDANAGRTRSLSERDALALAGQWYRWYTAQHEDNPGEPERWEGLGEGLDAILSRAHWEVDHGKYEIDAKEWLDCRQAIAREAGTDRFIADRAYAALMGLLKSGVRGGLQAMVGRAEARLLSAACFLFDRRSLRSAQDNEAKGLLARTW